MRMKDFLSEAPLPDDWDHGQMVARPGTTIKSRLDYALERAQRIGQGSSRVALVIEFQGRPTVLKVAKNRKGMAQNLEEVDILSDGYFSKLGILIPLIDYDQSGSVSWLQTEMAAPFKSREALAAALGCDIMKLLEYSRRIGMGFSDEFYDVAPERRADVQELATSLDDLANNSTLDLEDCMQPSNWGMYQGRPVIIDAGFAGSAIPMYRRY
jgi:hypothetical protein